MRTIRRWCAAILIVLAGLFSSPRTGEAAGPAPVLVYYYAWWAPQAVGPGKSPDWPVTPYHSWDTAVMQQHVSQIAGAGIDGMLVAWYGPTETNNQTETNFRTILDLAAANGTTALLSVDLGSAAWFTSPQQIAEAMRYAIDVHAQHPAYFRLNGKPVFYFWYQGRYSLADWASIRQQVDPDHNTIWIAEGAAPDTLPTFDGLHMYTISWAPNVAGTLSQWSSTVHARGGLWASTVMPGWDNTYTQQSERYIRERGDGAFLRETFSAAAASNPDMIIITSWNEWWEGTHIEPSVAYGDAYLNLTRELITQYKASGAVSGGGGASSIVPAATLAPSVQPATAPAISGSAAVNPTAAGLTPTLPPTITPAVASSATPAPTLTPLSAAEVVVTRVAVLPTPAARSPEAVEQTTPPENMRTALLAGGAVVAGIGVLLIAGAGFLLWREQARTRPRP